MTQYHFDKSTVATSSSSPIRLVWLDKNVLSKENQKTRTQLENFDKDLNTFLDESECVRLINRFGISETRCFVIVSRPCGESVIEKIQEKTHVLRIYVYCGNAALAKVYADKCDKAQVFTDPRKLVETIETDMKSFATS